MIVSLSARARADLVDIRDYLLPISPQGAESVRRAIADAVDLLGAFPRIGRETDIARVRITLICGEMPGSVTVWPEPKHPADGAGTRFS